VQQEIVPVLQQQEAMVEIMPKTDQLATIHQIIVSTEVRQVLQIEVIIPEVIILQIEIVL
jgi:hypothetical protein